MTRRRRGDNSEQNIRAPFSIMTTIAVYGPCSSLAVCTLWIYHLAQANPSGGQPLPGRPPAAAGSVADMVRSYTHGD